MDFAFRKLDELLIQQETAVRMQRFDELREPEGFPVLLAGGVGDVIMSIPLVQALLEYEQVDVYTAHTITYDYFRPANLAPAKKIPVPNYTWFLEVNAVARFRMLERFMGFQDPAIKALWENQVEQHRKHSKLRVTSHNHPLQDTTLCRYARDLGLDRRQFPFFSMGLSPRDKIKLPRKPAQNYITIHDGYEAESAFIVPSRATKTWKWTYWNDFVRIFKKEFPDIQVIQLGTSTAREIEGVDVCLINKTTLPQAFDLIAQSKLHVDGDSGLVHAATALSVPCVVMFGPTPDYFYGYPENINLTSNACEGACYWLSRDWLGKCPIGYLTPKCMDEITPAVVMEGVRKTLSQ